MAKKKKKDGMGKRRVESNADFPPWAGVVKYLIFYLYLGTETMCLLQLPH